MTVEYPNFAQSVRNSTPLVFAAKVLFPLFLFKCHFPKSPREVQIIGLVSWKIKRGGLKCHIISRVSQKPNLPALLIDWKSYYGSRSLWSLCSLHFEHALSAVCRQPLRSLGLVTYSACANCKSCQFPSPKTLLLQLFMEMFITKTTCNIAYPRLADPK